MDEDRVGQTPPPGKTGYVITFLILYKWSWAAAVFGGAALALVGSHMAARNQAVQTLVISQGASLGVVIALAFTHAHGQDSESAIAFWPSLIGLTMAGAAYLFCEWAIPQRWPSRNTYFVGIFALTLATTYLIISLVPSLETHMAASFFGDISVASDGEARLIALIGLLSGSFVFYKWNAIVKWSFEQVIFRSFHASRRDRSIQYGFLAATLITITACVQFLGLLFTLSCLFLPAMVLSRTQQNLRGLATKLVVSSALGVTLGLGLSLWQGRLPTSPTLTLSLLLTSLALGLLVRSR